MSKFDSKRPIFDPCRQAGRTTKRMKEAEPGAIYVWPSLYSIHYAKNLARDLGRDDLRIISAGSLNIGHIRGRTPVPKIVFDHAVDAENISQQTWDELLEMGLL